MRIAFKIVAVLLLALWVPATQHCDLEAAGLTDSDHHASTCKNGCNDDACHSIEGESYGKTWSDVKVLPPSPSFAFCLLDVLAAPALVECAPESLAADPPEIEALHRTWHFVRRTALPVRAPDCLV